MSAASSGRRLPDFLVVGAQKSGTTSIYRCLAEHPEVFVPKVKEVSFFHREVNYRMGLDFYARFFEAAGDARRVGEVSPGYLYSSEAPGRIARDLPDVRLVASLRHPVDRAYSAYRMQVVKGSEVKPFEEAIESNPTYLEYGRYSVQLGRYLEHFPRERLLVVLFDRLVADPAAFYRSIFAFLGVRDDVELASFTIKKTTGRPRFTWLPRLIYPFYRLRALLRRTPLRRLVNARLVDHHSRRLRGRIISLNQMQEPYPPMEPAIRERLVERFAGEVDALEALTGFDLAAWRR